MYARNFLINVDNNFLRSNFYLKKQKLAWRTKFFTLRVNRALKRTTSAPFAKRKPRYLHLHQMRNHLQRVRLLHKSLKMSGQQLLQAGLWQFQVLSVLVTTSSSLENQINMQVWMLQVKLCYCGMRSNAIEFGLEMNNSMVVLTGGRFRATVW